MPKIKATSYRYIGFDPGELLRKKLLDQAEKEQREVATLVRLIVARWFDQEAKQKSA